MERKPILDLTIEDYVEESSYEEDYSEKGEIDLIDPLIYERSSYSDSKSSLGTSQAS
jgi:hypothetical protein